MKLTPIRQHIIFQFLDEVDNKGRFITTTKWGFVVPGHFDNSAKLPRWGTVVSVGSDCKTVKPGQQVLINALKWTEGFEIDKVKMWRTDEDQIVASRNTLNGGMTLFRDTVVFEREDLARETTHSGLQVIGGIQDTPRGTVVQSGPDISEELLDGATIYYSDQNFFNQFEHKGKKLWYIEETNILAYQLA